MIVQELENNITYTKFEHDDESCTETYSININGSKLLHREDGPAYIHSENGLIKEETNYIYGQIHKVDGPARIRYGDDGQIFTTYFLNDEMHRLDGPANLLYINKEDYENNKPKDFTFYINGKWLNNIHTMEQFDVYKKTLCLT